ncbi:hypothetical protein RQP46_007274 [Phenoliferia psychrophenolica]
MLLRLLVLIVLAVAAQAKHPTTPSLDLNSPSALKAATTKALSNLLRYYKPNPQGTFVRDNTAAWYESGVMWGAFMDYEKWSGDDQFAQTAAEALAHMAFNKQQDFLNGVHAKHEENKEGKWNDDILFGSLAVIGGAELYGPSTTMPSTSGGDWFTTARKTYEEAWEQWDDKCGGGIYWARDRNASSKTYKSSTTNLEFIAQGARNYIQVRNETVIAMAERTVDWLFGESGLVDVTVGVVYDGLNVDDCSEPTYSQWSYNPGQLMGAMAWMHQATSNATYLTLANLFVNKTLSTWFTTENDGVLAELCEADSSCNPDQYGFKAILVRNLAYLYRATKEEWVRRVIKNAIDTTVRKMLLSCDQDFNCGGKWANQNHRVYYVRDQHVSASLLVAALAMHTNATGPGLLPHRNVTALKTSGGK